MIHGGDPKRRQSCFGFQRFGRLLILYSAFLGTGYHQIQRQKSSYSIEIRNVGPTPFQQSNWPFESRAGCSQALLQCWIDGATLAGAAGASSHFVSFCIPKSKASLLAQLKHLNMLRVGRLCAIVGSWAEFWTCQHLTVWADVVTVVSTTGWWFWNMFYFSIYWQ